MDNENTFKPGREKKEVNNLSRNESQCKESISGIAGSVPESPGSCGVPARTFGTNPLHDADRATVLKGKARARSRVSRSVRRRQTNQDLHDVDPEIPYLKFEKAARDLVCALMERQDRMNESLFCTINDLEYRLGDVEQDLLQMKQQKGRSP